MRGCGTAAFRRYGQRQLYQSDADLFVGCDNQPDLCESFYHYAHLYSNRRSQQYCDLFANYYGKRPDASYRNGGYDQCLLHFGCGS